MARQAGGTKRAAAGLACLAASLALPLPALSAPQVARTYHELASERDRKAAKALNAIQVTSFRQNREYCGVLYRTGGQIYASKPAKGNEATCSIRFIDHTRARIIATYHTHSAYAPHIDSEVPSRTDMASANRSNLDDYVITPGGRLWRVNGREQTIDLICDVGCLKQDPRFKKCASNAPRRYYDRDGLNRRKEGIELPCPDG